VFLKIAACTVLVGLATPAQADDAPTPSQKAWEAANKVAQHGPMNVALLDQAKLHLPSDMDFIPKAESEALMVSWGNGQSPELVGMIAPRSPDQGWVMTIDYMSEGHVNDEDAKKWNADDLLASIREGTTASNEERVKQGFPEMEILGWVEQPKYDSGLHKLIWSMKAQDKGATPDDPKNINYNTYALGRDGYFKLDLITDDKHIESEKAYAQTVLAALDYNVGKKYEDFKPGTDHVAEYGIAALIGGAVAHKL
jgi:uncharacterized membrane-anchored protein